MTRKRNPLVLFLVSLMPGAGEMYLGFFKQGISVMSIFLLMFAFSNVFYTPLFFLTPVLWFYSFFHSNNINSLPDEEFYSMEDDYFLHMDSLFKDNGALFRRHSKLVAAVLIFLGASILWNNFSDTIHYISYNLFHLPDSVSQLLYRLTDGLPDSVMAVGIIVLGIYMIKNKKDSLKNNGIS